jgi:KDO2-lipid IV(A) lauroyltransferase
MGIARLASALPERSALKAGVRLGTLAHNTSARYRNVAIKNLTQVFGEEWDRDRIERTALLMFQHLGMSVIEFLRFRTMDPAHIDALVRVEGEEYAKAALAAGKGLVAISAHYGNFELFGAAFARKGYPLSVIARDADDGPTNDLINGIREHMGYRVFPRQNAARRSMAVLRHNEVLGVLPDQNDLDGVFLPFLGRLAATSTGPAYMALRTGATILPAFIHREPDNTHVVEIRPPIEYTPTGDIHADVKALSLKINQAIEVAIREHPEQWLWLHNRWKLRPPEESPVEPEGAQVG